MTKTALVTGITGQDGSYLAEFLLDKNYTVVGLHRRSSTNNTTRFQHYLHHPNFSLEEFDLTDPSGINQTIIKYQPDEFYNLAAQSHVGTSFKQPTVTFEADAIGVINILEAIRHYSPNTKFYQAGTSEMFGRNFTLKNNEKYQDENTPMLPQSPYGVAKLAAYHMVQIYRSAYDMFCCCGILFNHESPRRGENFVTRKITRYIARLLKHKTTDKLKLGNLNAYRDWGHAKDYVEAMFLMLQNDNPKDYVIATGETHSVQEFLEKAFALANLNHKDLVEIDPELFRPAEVDYLKGDCSLAKAELNWSPKISFDNLIKDMVNEDCKYA
jgi:GDPmannose 4,6-dehydratase